MCWSPDSRFLGFWAGGKLKKVEATGGSPQIICETSVALGGAWNADGFIVFGSNAHGLSRVPASGGTPVLVTQPDAARQETYHCWPFFLPDGKHVIYLAGVTTDLEQNTLYVGRLDADGTMHNRKRLMTSRSGAVYVPSSDENQGHLLF